MLEVIRAGFWLARPYSRRLVHRLVKISATIITSLDPRPCCPRSLRRIWDPDYIISARELILSFSSGSEHTDQLAEILPRVSRTPLGEDCESGRSITEILQWIVWLQLTVQKSID